MPLRLLAPLPDRRNCLEEKPRIDSKRKYYSTKTIHDRSTWYDDLKPKQKPKKHLLRTSIFALPLSQMTQENATPKELEIEYQRHKNTVPFGAGRLEAVFHFYHLQCRSIFQHL